MVANVFAVSMTSIPAYLLNRYWVWGKNDKNRFWGEIAPFWGMTIAGLVLSTLFVAIATQWSDSTIIVSLANLARIRRFVGREVPDPRRGPVQTPAGGGVEWTSGCRRRLKQRTGSCLRPRGSHCTTRP